MWRVFEFVFIGVVVLVAITEFFYPLIAGKPFFGSFKKTTDPEPPLNKPKEEVTLNEKLDAARIKVEEIKATQSEVNSNYKSAEQLKDESDSLFNKF